MEISTKKLKILELLETKQFEKINQLDLTVDEAKWIFENYKLLQEMEESSVFLNSLNHTNIDELIQLVIKTSQKIQGELNLIIKNFKELTQEKIDEAFLLLCSKKVLVRENQGNTSATNKSIIDKFSRQGKTIDTKWVIFEKKKNHYIMRTKIKISKLRIKQLDGKFEVIEKNSYPSDYILTNGRYYLDFDDYRFDLTLKD